MSQKLQIIGLGYIGLPTALITANQGIQTRGVDLNSNYIEKIKNKALSFKEKGFKNILNKVLSTGVFTPSTEIEEADIF